MRAYNTAFSKDKLSYAVNLMGALAHPLRLKIVEYIDRCGETHVKRIYKDLDLEQSITSQHLKVLKDAGVVSNDKEGKFVIYTLNYPVLEKVQKAIDSYKAIEAMRVN